MIPNPKILVESGREALFALPARRKPPMVDWQDEDGLEVDLSTPLWMPSTMTMSMHVAPGADDYFNTSMMSEFVPIFLPESYRYIKLRYVSASNLTYRGGFRRKAPKWATLDINLENDDPEQVIRGVVPSPIPARFESLVSLNGADLSSLGVVVSEVYNTALLPAELKEIPYWESEFATGRRLFPGAPRYKVSRPINLQSSISYTSTDDLLGVLSALWAIVSNPGAITMGVANQSVQCYYESMTDLDYTTSRLKFNLNFRTI